MTPKADSAVNAPKFGVVIPMFPGEAQLIWAFGMKPDQVKVKVPFDVSEAGETFRPVGTTMPMPSIPPPPPPPPPEPETEMSGKVNRSGSWAAREGLQAREFDITTSYCTEVEA